MNHAHKPKLEELPSRATLFRSSIIAGVSAVAILLTVVLPAEYAIDPTGVGRVIGLTEMGEIKRELATEAAQDELLHGDRSSGLLDAVFGMFVGTAHAQEAWRDEITFTLKPGATADIKMVMEEGNTVNYAWFGTGGRVNFDLHAHGGTESIDYERGRGQTAGDGSIEATFAGEHGWFWRNRDSTAITITIQLRGTYSEVVETY